MTFNCEMALILRYLTEFVNGPYYRLEEPILEILYGAKTVFTRSAITPPKVNRFGCNLEQCEPNVGGWPWQILCAIRAVASV